MTAWIVAAVLAVAGGVTTWYFRLRAKNAEKVSDARGTALKVVAATNDMIRKELVSALEAIRAAQAKEKTADDTAAKIARESVAGAAGFLAGSTRVVRGPGDSGGGPAPALVPDRAGAGSPGPVERRPLPL